MSMTENEAKGFVKGKLNCMNKCDVFDCKNTDECDNCKYCYSQGNFGQQKEAFKVAIKALKEIQQYRAIGTIEEFKELKEKSVVKKPIEVDSDVYDYPYDYECPNCRKNVDETDHHCECGQKLDWSE